MLNIRLTFFLLLLTGNLLSQQDEKNLWCHELNSSAGLSSQEYNFFAFTDSEGFTWISSTRGLNRFDGTHVKTYRSDFQDSTALFGENIQSNFFEDADQNLWFCTYEGVHLYNRKKDNFQHFFVKDSKGDTLREDYYVFHLEQDRFLWFRAGRGIFRVDISNINVLPVVLSDVPLFHTPYYHGWVGTDHTGEVTHVFTTADEKIYGLDCFEINNGQLVDQHTFFEPTELRDDSLGIFQVFFEREDKIWLCTSSGLHLWDFTNNALRSMDLQRKNNPYIYITPFDEEHFIVSVYEKGLYLFHKTLGTYLPYNVNVINSSSAIDRFRNIYLSPEKVLWITVPFKGVFYAHLEKNKFLSVPKSDHGDITNYLPMIKSPAGQVYTAHGGGLLHLDQQGRIINHFSDSNLPFVKHLCSSKDTTTIGLATRSGVFFFDLSSQNFFQIPGTGGIDFLYVYQLTNETWLASSLIEGVFQISQKKGKWTSQKLIDSKGVGYTAIHQDNDGLVYICRNESGIKVFSYDGNQLIPQRELPVQGAVYTYFEDPDQEDLWIGTSFGLVKLNQKDPNASVQWYTQQKGLPDNNIFCIIPADRSTFWLSTNNGLVLMDRETESFHSFSLADGMLSQQFNPRSGLKLNDRTIWFGGKNGITIVPFRSIPYIKTPSKILVTNILINDEESDSITCSISGATNPNQIKKLEYPYWQNTFSFRFVTTDYADSQNTQLKYKMVNVDNHFVELNRGNDGFARYPNLASGNYRFIIEGVNSDRRPESATSRFIDIVVLPPFWETWWFRSLLALLVVSIVGSIIWIRIRQIKEKENLKTRIAENKMTTLVAQMNPHFIFNSLQSVNRFILQKNRKQASEYLGRFSKLIRMMLENSRNTSHLLDEEVKFLDHYMTVEAQRFKNPFDYTIKVDEDIRYNTIIPTMMLQPFIENAIWHGLSNKKGDGKIMIDIEKNGSTLNCVIEDNGVGRQIATGNALKKGKKHKSMGLDIVKERLQLLFPNQQDLCSINFTDLKDEKGTPAGTRVSIRLPVQD